MDSYRVTQKISMVGMLVNLLLAALKTAVGILGRSQAMMADGLNSAGDVLNSLLTYWGNRLASKPRDDDHPFGHGKAEFIFSFLIALVLLGVAVSCFASGFRSLLSPEPLLYTPLLPIVAVVTIGAKWALYALTQRAAKKYGSLLLRANAQDHKGDMLVTTGMLIGILGAHFGLRWLDGAVGMLISLWIGVSGVRILLAAYRVLMDTAGSRELRRAVEDRIARVPGVDHIDSVSSTPVGLRFLLLVKVSVDGGLTVIESHAIAKRIENVLMDLGEVADVVVHINPV